MSTYIPALNFVLDNEDHYRKYANVPDAPPGAHAISGINSAAYPEQYAKILAIPQAQRGPAISDFYLTEFWTPLGASGLNSQDVANRVLDQAVNGGLKSGGTLLQIAANACGSTLVVDGSIGPHTCTVVNALDEDTLLSAFKTARINHYKAIALHNPADAKYLAEWLGRASQ